MTASPLSRLAASAQLHLAVIAIRVAFALARRRDPRFRRALASGDSIYLFRAGSASRQLLISAGGVRTHGGSCAHPDLEVIFSDLTGALRHLAREPDNLFQLVVENRIEQIGNKYHLFRFGYLCGLCGGSLRSLLSGPGPRPSRFALRGDRR